MTLTKAQVRAEAARLGLRTATKPDSQDVCFITRAGGRRAFLAPRLALHPGRVVDGQGRLVGQVAAVELVTVGQRRGLGLAGQEDGQYAVDVDVANRVVRVGRGAERDRPRGRPGPGRVGRRLGWPSGRLARRRADRPDQRPRRAAAPAQVLTRSPDHRSTSLRWTQGPQPRVAPGQSVVLYQGDRVVGGGIAT